MDALDADGIPYDDTPGVSSFCGAAAALNAEYTLPTISQTVIITRMEGRTPVPEKEQLASLAAHGATMVIFLSIGLIDKVQQALLAGGATRRRPLPPWSTRQLAGAEGGALHRGHTGREHPRQRHHQNSAHRGGGVSGHPV